MGVFAQAAGKAKSAFTSNYCREGRYLVIINSGKEDMHAGSNTPQVIFEGTVIKVVDPGPPQGQRWKPSKGGNESPHTVGEPFTFYFGMKAAGSPGRLRRLILVANGVEEKDLPPSLHPVTGVSLALPASTPIDAATGAPVAAGTAGSMLSVDPVEFAITKATDPKVNALCDVVLEVRGSGIVTQGRNGNLPQNIIAVDPMRRVSAREIHAGWETLAQAAQDYLKKDGRIDRMLRGEDAERNAQAAQVAQATAGAAR